MAVYNKPDEHIFASQAKQGEVDNFPDLLRGWGISFDQTNGIPPMEWFNGLFKRADEKHGYLMQRGLPEWSATQDYPLGAFIQHNGLSYKSLRANKNKQPNTNTADWQRWGFTLTEIAKATLTQQGIVQLDSSTNSNNEERAATPKAIKTLKDLIDALTRNQANYIPNSKKSTAVNSNSADTVATSSAVKTAYDKAVSVENNNLYQKIYVGKADLTLDLTNKQQIIDLFGDKYRENGYLSFAAHNNATSNITGLPLTTKSPVILTFYLMGGYSTIYCHYPSLGRMFYTNANFNERTLTLNWIEQIASKGDQKDIGGYKSFNSTLESKYRVLIRRNEVNYYPYMLLIDQSVPMNGSTARQKNIGEFLWNVGEGDGISKAVIRTVVLEDKNAFTEIAGWDSDRKYKLFFKGFTKTNNVVIGRETDNEKDRLQVAGTISANTPPVNGTDDQVVTIGWAKNAARGYVSKSGDTMTGNLTLPHITIQDREAFATVKSSNNDNASVDFIVQNGAHPQATVRAHDVGGYAVELQFHTTPKGSNYSTDRRQHMMTIAHDGNIWAKPYGWLHDFFAKQSDNNNIWNVLNNQVVKRDDFIRSWYPNHYNGTEVYKIKHLGLMITLMNATGDKELILPENYDGHFIVLATDRGQGRIPVNSNYGIANNRIRVGGRSDTAVSVLVIGQKSI